MKKTIILTLTLILALSLLTACEEGDPLKQCVVSRRVEKSTERHKKKKEEKEKKAENALPDLHAFTAQTLDGGTFSEKDLTGKDLTVINIWQTTCAPCIEELPFFEQLKTAYMRSLHRGDAGTGIAGSFATGQCISDHLVSGRHGCEANCGGDHEGIRICQSYDYLGRR